VTVLANYVVFKLACPSCGLENDLTLSQILLSQDLAAECSCRGESECPPFYFAGLLDHVDIEELLTVWRRLETQADRQGGKLEILGPAHRDPRQPAR